MQSIANLAPQLRERGLIFSCSALWQAGRRALHSADRRQPLRDLRPARAAGGLFEAAFVGFDVRYRRGAGAGLSAGTGRGDAALATPSALRRALGPSGFGRHASGRASARVARPCDGHRIRPAAATRCRVDALPPGRVHRAGSCSEAGAIGVPESCIAAVRR